MTPPSVKKGDLSRDAAYGSYSERGAIWCVAIETNGFGLFTAACPLTFPYKIFCRAIGLQNYTDSKETAMRRTKAAFAVTAVLIAAMGLPVFAKGHAGGGGSHAYSGGRAPVTHGAASPHYGGRAAVGVFVGAAIAAPLFIAAPRYYYPPPVRYVTPVVSPAYWYYCPPLNAYYPYVQECPAPWQPVLPQPSY